MALGTSVMYNERRTIHNRKKNPVTDQIAFLGHIEHILIRKTAKKQYYHVIITSIMKTRCVNYETFPCLKNRAACCLQHPVYIQGMGRGKKGK